MGKLIRYRHRMLRHDHRHHHDVQVNQAVKAEHRVSVIVPTLNEQARIGRLLEALAQIQGLHEIIVADGGSRDETTKIARSFPKVRTLVAPRGRASQMNAAAKEAIGTVVLFLHADVVPPIEMVTWVEKVLTQKDVVAGAFRTWTVPDTRRTWLGPFLHLADLRSRYSALPYGDQAIFVRREAFWQVGGFPNQPIFEDLELGRKLSKIGRIHTVPANVFVSGRRFVAHPLYYTIIMNLFPLLYRLGIPTTLLARFYGNPR